ncbi:MAG: hypothetical protein KAJ93_02260, partial [Methanosarcinales archaeon]|nr:hypothetical protein [Methanosarcinales archaeon]
RNNVWSIKLEAVTVPSDAVGKAQALIKFITTDLAAMDETMREVFVKNDVRAKFGLDKGEINKLLRKAESQLHEVVELDDRFFDERGRFKVKSMSEYVMGLSHFITLEDNKNLYHYDNGLYILRGEDLITKIVQTALGDASKIQHINEVIHHIKYETLIPRDYINNESCSIPLINGVYNLETDNLEPHSHENIFIHQIPVEYNRDAECPAFNKFISEITNPEKPEDIQTLYEYIGYCLIPDTRIQKALMCIGTGSNGKSKLLEAIGAFVGSKNTSGQSLQKLENNPYSPAELFGKLVNIFPDLASGAIYENSVFKMLTGDEGEITAERKYEHQFKFKNTARLIFSANKLPPVPADDMAYMRRWVLLEFPHKFEGADIDINLGAKLSTTEEQSGLLNIVIPALKTILKNGDYSNIQTTEEINRMYRINSDPIASFADECIVASEDDTWKILIYERYVKWCTENSKEPKTSPVFAKRFSKFGFSSSKESFIGSNGKRNPIWENCSIKKSVRATEIYPDGQNHYQEVRPSGCPSKNTLCNIQEENKIEKESNVYTCKQRDNYPDTRTLSRKDGTEQYSVKRPGKKTTPDVTRTAAIDIKYLTKMVISYKDRLHPSGVIPNYEQFALIVRNQNKELKEVYTVEQIEQITRKLAKEGW